MAKIVTAASALSMEAPEVDFVDNQQQTKGKSLPDLFQRDVLVTAQKEEHSLSFWNKLIHYLSFGWVPLQAHLTDTVKGLPQEGVKPIASGDKIDRRPVLDPPHTITRKEIKPTIPNGISPSASKKCVSDMASLELIIMDLIKNRLEMQERQGVVSTATLEKFQHLRRVSKEFLSNLQDEIDKNDKIANGFSWAQSITAYSAILLVLGGFFAPPLGVAAGIVGGVGGALSTVGKTYYDKKKKEGQAERTDRDYQKETISDGLSIQQGAISDAVEQISKLNGDLFDLQEKKSRIVDLVKQR